MDCAEGLATIDEQILKVVKDIDKVQEEIEAAFPEWKNASKDDKPFWSEHLAGLRKEKEQLRNREEQLRKEKEQLLEKEKLLLQDRLSPTQGAAAKGTASHGVKFTLPVGVHHPSGQSVSVRKSVDLNTLAGSATIHLSSLVALDCCERSDVPQEMLDISETLINTLRMFNSERFKESGLFGPAQPSGELRDSSVLQERLCHTCGTLPNGGVLRWHHQLPDPVGGKPDIALYVSHEHRPEHCVPVGVIEVGYADNTSKASQTKAYACNLAMQWAGHDQGEQGLLAASLLLDRHGNYAAQCVDLWGFARAFESEAKGKAWCARIWKSSDAQALARVLWAMTSVAEFNLIAMTDLDEPPLMDKLALSEHTQPFRPNMKHERLGPNTCRIDNWVFKCFDYRYRKVDVTQRRSPALSVARLDAEVVIDAQDLTLIKYPCIAGNHTASRVAQFVAVIMQIKKLHIEGMCHGDVRASNILFNDTGSQLIDFDFSGTHVNEKKYPDGFNRNIPDGSRHEDAQAGGQLQPGHDWFALASVMRLHRCNSEDEDKVWKQATQHTQESRIEEALESLADHLQTSLEVINASLFPTLKGSGSPNRPIASPKSSTNQTSLSQGGSGSSNNCNQSL